MVRLLDMDTFISDAESMHTRNCGVESPLFEKYPQLSEGIIFPLDQEWTHGSRWAIVSYEIDGGIARASLVYYFDITTKLWYGDGDTTEEGWTFQEFRDRYQYDIVRLIPKNCIPDAWSRGKPKLTE